MLDQSIYEVTRDDYKGFINQIKPECREVKEEQVGYKHIATKIFSKKTGKCLCSRLTDTADNENHEPEKYFIFEMPDDDERQPPTQTVKVVLNTKEEVQKFFDFLAQQKEKNNG